MFLGLSPGKHLFLIWEMQIYITFSSLFLTPWHLGAGFLSIAVYSILTKSLQKSKKYFYKSSYICHSLMHSFTNTKTTESPREHKDIYPSSYYWPMWNKYIKTSEARSQHWQVLTFPAQAGSLSENTTLLLEPSVQASPCSQVDAQGKSRLLAWTSIKAGTAFEFPEIGHGWHRSWRM